MCMTCILCIYLGIMVGILFVYLASSCEVYQINSAQLTVTTTELHPVPVYTTWYHVAIDFVGPISHSLSGNRCAHIGDEFVCMCVCVCMCASH